MAREGQRYQCYQHDMMMMMICANIRIYVRASNSTNTNILSFKTTLTYTQTKFPSKQLTYLIGVFLKNSHSDECVKHETESHRHYHAIYIYVVPSIVFQISFVQVFKIVCYCYTSSEMTDQFL